MCKDLDQRHDIRGRKFAQASRDLEMLDQIADAARRKLRRSGQQQRFHDLRKALELGFKSGIDFGVMLRELGDFVEGLTAILPHEKATAVGKGREEGGVLGIDLVAVAREFEIADDAFLQKRLVR